MIKFAVVGTGWRSRFYARIAKALPDKFELVAWLCRNEEKKETLYKEFGFFTTMDEAEVIKRSPDFIVSAVNKTSMSDVVRYWASKGFPVLSETPAALDIDTLKLMKKEVEKGYKIQVAEQYFMYPSIKAVIDEINKGTIGTPVSLSISAMHDYHAASVIRRMLDTKLESVTITGKSFDMQVTDTKNRYETLTDGNVVTKEEKHLIMEYETGKVAFYDFMSDQYRSLIRNRYINIRGTRGEIINNTVYYLDENNLDTSKELEIINEFEQYGFSEDEAAIASLMLLMKDYIESGKEIYPMNEALYDAYMSILMCDAGKDSYVSKKAKFNDLTGGE